MYQSHQLIKELRAIDTKKITQKKLIELHIKAENNGKKDDIDEYHSELFRGYSTIRGYQLRIKKISPYPYGTPILGVLFIMYFFDDEELARKEASIICSHPQTLLACNALITLMKNKSLDDVREMVKDDEQLLAVCNDKIDFKKTNYHFLPLWCRHYFLFAMAGYFSLPLPSGIQHPHILYLIYCIVRDTFHPPQS